MSPRDAEITPLPIAHGVPMTGISDPMSRISWMPSTTLSNVDFLASSSAHASEA
jgi:hypothetical protein